MLRSVEQPFLFERRTTFNEDFVNQRTSFAELVPSVYHISFANFDGIMVMALKNAIDKGVGADESIWLHYSSACSSMSLSERQMEEAALLNSGFLE